ncbi:hypothetical protein SAMN05444483_1054 [Salegentibacter echinorum]|uniref:GLPGLI family protein n=1 Tax=Salegentibacter echinorum TaxID=1073325 RepID=A0A1M5H5Z8_SALEC|nr:hypothetical protein [Salegentibacter echinorum]SHG11417.1 hypothetical protein SAMN05444483_1054 [Salegentibacter echinorum]
MKNTILLLFLLFTIHQSSAECAMSGFTYYPEHSAISQNSIFIIEGYSFSQKVINSFKNDREAYLQSEDGEKIDLILKEILIGQMSLTQATFKPAEKLELNKKYFLKFTHLTNKENYNELTRYNRETKEHEPVAWKVTDNNTEELSDDLSLKFEKTDVQYYGCGPAAYAVFQPQNSSDLEIWYRTEVYDEKTKTSTIYIIKTWKEKLQVGHGMCSGGFTFSKDGDYKVRFTPMNIDGKN